jgi:two-component system nitrogen regulation response regulator GlnG
LFGHERGAFTGADRRRIGKFEQCNGGTILLDEIGDMPLSLQAKMLRLLQDQSFERLGGTKTVQTDVRIIAATHRDLRAMSQQGTFRADLYYRLDIFTVHLPPLRQRGEADVAMLVRHFLRRFNRELNRDVRMICPEAMAKLCAHSWPGNVRELQSVLKQALLNSTGSVLVSSLLPDVLHTGCSQSVATAMTDHGRDFQDFIDQRLAAGSIDLLNETQVELDRVLLPAALRFANDNQSRAAEILGVARQTLRQRLRNIGLNLASRPDQPTPC